MSMPLPLVECLGTPRISYLLRQRHIEVEAEYRLHGFVLEGYTEDLLDS